MTPPQPVTVTIDVPQPRAAVYDYLDVMANHEAFTDHMLTNWRVSGPATGIGSKAHVTTKVGGMTDEAVIEVFEIDPGRMIRERSIGAKGKRIAHGTYTLSATSRAAEPTSSSSSRSRRCPRWSARSCRSCARSCARATRRRWSAWPPCLADGQTQSKAA